MENASNNNTHEKHVPANAAAGLSSKWRDVARNVALVLRKVLRTLRGRAGCTTLLATLGFCYKNSIPNNDGGSTRVSMENQPFR